MPQLYDPVPALPRRPSVANRPKPKPRPTPVTNTATAARESFAPRPPGHLTKNEKRIQDDVLKNLADSMGADRSAVKKLAAAEGRVIRAAGQVAEKKAAQPTNKKYTVYVPPGADSEVVARAINTINKEVGRDVVATTTHRSRADAVLHVSDTPTFGDPAAQRGVNWAGLTNKQDVRNRPLAGQTNTKDRVTVRSGLSAKDTKEVIEHELVHGLGLGHVPVPPKPYPGRTLVNSSEPVKEPPTMYKPRNVMNPSTAGGKNLNPLQERIIREAYQSGQYTDPTRRSQPKRGRKK